VRELFKALDAAQVNIYGSYPSAAIEYKRNAFILLKNCVWCYTSIYSLFCLHRVKRNGLPMFPSMVAFVKMDSTKQLKSQYSMIYTDVARLKAKTALKIIL